MDRSSWTGQSRVAVAWRMSTVIAAVLLGTAGDQLWAQDKPLPKAEQVLKQVVEAMGGEAAFAKLRNRVSKGTFELPAQGIKGTLASYEAEGNKSYSVVELEGMGRIESGSDGKVYWDRNPAIGPRILEGEEKALQARHTAFNAAVHWPRLYKEVETLGVETLDSGQCYKIQMTPPIGSPETWYVGVKSHLVVRVDLTYKGAMGEVPIQTFIEDYREIDGVKLPYRIRQRLAETIEQVMTIQSIEHNADISRDRFALPPDIKELLNRRSEKP